jgi:hypothetical protein
MLFAAMEEPIFEYNFPEPYYEKQVHNPKKEAFNMLVFYLHFRALKLSV